MRDAGIPAVVLGPGSVVEQAHRPDESVELAEVVTAARAYALCAIAHDRHLSALTASSRGNEHRHSAPGVGDQERLGRLEAPVVHPHPDDHVEGHARLAAASCRPGRRLIVCSPQSGG